MVDISTISIAVASVSVVVGVTYYSFQIRHQTKTRQTELIMRLYSTFTSRELQEEFYNLMIDMETMDYQDIAKKYSQMAPGIGLFFER